MARLEYRLFEEGGDFPLLYYYDQIERDEAALRFACDYLVKEGKVFEKTSAAIEDSCYVIYVKPAEDEKVMSWSKPDSEFRQGFTMELREFQEYATDYRLIHTYHFEDSLDVVLYLTANYLYIDGQEWYKTSVEIDEDRATLVYYAVKSS